MSQKNDIANAINDLINDAQRMAATSLMEAPALVVHDETTPNISKFSDEAIKMLGNKIGSLLHQRNEIVHPGHDGLAEFLGKLKLKNANDFRPSYKRVADLVHFFGITYWEHQKQLATEVMISIINDLAKDGVITGTLAPLSSIDLFVNMPPKRHIIFFYGAVNYQQQAYVEQKYGDFSFKEGSIPKTLEEIAHKYYGEQFLKAFEEIISDAV